MAEPKTRFLITIDNLTKTYGELVAVDGISLDIKEGEVFGLLGPNGAGKTTLISMLCTITSPSKGGAKVNGFDIVKSTDGVRKSIGIVFQDPSLDDRLTARENLDLHARLYGMDARTRKERTQKVLGVVELNDRADALVRTFSGGMKRRLEIARGLMHYPKILFLDEPTIGLDPQTREHVWKYVRELAKQERITIVMTTHYMEEADMLCDRIAVIDHGKIIALGTPEELKSSLGGETITLSLAEPNDTVSKEKIVKSYGQVKEFDGKLSIRVKSAEKEIKNVCDFAKKESIQISEISMHKPTLNDVFLQLTGREIRDEKANSKDSMRAHMMMRGRA